MLRLALILPLFFGPAVGFPGKGSPGEPCPVGNAGGPEPANPDVTKKGCTCTTECGASLPDGFNIAWCYTKDGCGSWSFGGTWDECVYPVDKAWERWELVSGWASGTSVSIRSRQECGKGSCTEVVVMRHFAYHRITERSSHSAMAY